MSRRSIGLTGALTAVAVSAVLALAMTGCDPDSCANPSAPGCTPTPTSTATPTPRPTVGPTLVVTSDRTAGRQPVRVSFSLCGSRDGSGGTALDYLASFEGEPLAKQGGCGFSHEYRSTGVTVFDTRFCVQDTNAQQACRPYPIKAYIGLSLRVERTGCAGTVVATATELRTAASDVRAMADLDNVEFEAFTEAGQLLARLIVPKQGGAFTTGTWDLKNTTKLRIRAWGWARNVRGDDSTEAERPACGS